MLQHWPRLIRKLFLILLSYAWLFDKPNGALSQSGEAVNDWPIFRGNPQLTGVSGASLPKNLEPLWTFQTSEGLNPRRLSPAALFMRPRWTVTFMLSTSAPES
jgi:hypothetical protein